MTTDSLPIPLLVDRKQLLAAGLGEESVERMKLALGVVRLPGDRKWYLRADEVARYIDDHTEAPMRGAA